MLDKHKKIVVKNLGLLDFEKTFHIQKDLQNQIIETKLNNRKNNLNSITPNFLLFVEHDHVYTLGNSGNENNLIFDKKRLEEMGIKSSKELGEIGKIKESPEKFKKLPEDNQKEFFNKD